MKWFHPHFCLQADHKCPSPNLQLTQTDSPPAGEFSHKSTYSCTPPPITQQQQQKQSRFFLLTQWTPHLDSLADPLQAGLNMQLWEDGAAWAEQWTEQLRLGEDECVCVCEGARERGRELEREGEREHREGTVIMHRSSIMRWEMVRKYECVCVWVNENCCYHGEG